MKRNQSSALLPLLYRLIVMLLSGLLTIIVSRIMVLKYGIGTYAAIMTISSLPLLFPTADLGTAAPVINQMSRSSNPKDENQLKVLVSAVIKILTFAATILALAFVLLLISHGTGTFLGKSTSGLPHADLVFFIIAMLIVGFLPASIGVRIMQGLGRNDLAIASTILIPMVGALTFFTITNLKIPVAFLALYPAVGMSVASMVAFYVSLKLLDWKFYEVLRIKINGRIYKKIIRDSLPYLVVSLGLNIALQSDRLVLSHTTNSKQLAMYSSSVQLYTAFWSIIAAIGAGMWHKFRFVEHDIKYSKRLLVRAMYLYLCGGLLLAVSFYSLVPVFNTINLVHRLQLSSGLKIAFSSLLIVQSIQLPLGYFLTDERGLKMQSILVILMACFNLPISIILSRHFGAAGTIFGSTITICLFQLLPTLVVVRNRFINI